MNDQKHKNIQQFPTDWFASLKTWYYFRLCFSVSCFGYDLLVVKMTQTLNYYSFYTKVFIKTTNLRTCCWHLGEFNLQQKQQMRKKAIYFLSLMSYSINTLKVYRLFTSKKFLKKFLLQKMVRGWRPLPQSPPFPPMSSTLSFSIMYK